MTMEGQGGRARSMAGTGGRGMRKSLRFLHRLRMRRALGIKGTGVLRSFKPMRGRDRRRGTWWDKKRNCIAIEGQDFAQDTQEGGADEFELIPDSDEGGPQQVSSFAAEDEEFVPETEPQDMPVVKHISKQGGKKTRGHLRSMFQEWRKIVLESAKACTSQIGTSKENDHKDDAKDDSEHKASFSDVETDDEATPINVWEERGFRDLHTDADHWNQREGNDSDLLHKSFRFMKMEAMMSCTGGPSMDLHILICCLVKEARQLLFSLWWCVQVWYGHGRGMVEVVLPKLMLLAFMDPGLEKWRLDLLFEFFVLESVGADVFGAQQFMPSEKISSGFGTVKSWCIMDCSGCEWECTVVVVSGKE